MPRKFANGMLILALLVFAIASWQWLEDRETVEASAQSSISMAVNETDYTLEDFLITTVNNTEGQVYQIRGKSLSHFVSGSDSIIDLPEVKISGENGQHWSGTARFGYLSSDFVRLKLTGNVELSHRRGAGAPVNVATEVLHIDTKTRQMESAQPVDIRGKHWSLDAMQMQADLDKGILTFQSGVEANYGVFK